MAHAARSLQSAAAASSSPSLQPQPSDLSPCDSESTKRPRARLQLVDVLLWLVALSLGAALLAQLSRATRAESQRLSRLLPPHAHAGADPSALRGLARRVRQPLQLHTQTQSALAVNATAGGRQLLESPADAAASDVPVFFPSPFESEEQRIKLEAEWEAEFHGHSSRLSSGSKGLIEMLKPALVNRPVHAAPLGSSDYCVVALDGRDDADLVMVLRHTFHLLGQSPDAPKPMPGQKAVPRWSLMMWVTPQSEPFFVRELQVGVGLPGEHIVLHRVSPIAKRQASTVPMMRHFYEDAAPCEHLLLVQGDGMLLRSPRGALPSAPPLQPPAGSDFFDFIHQYVYLGAPWGWCSHSREEHRWCMAGGNGGTSYRRRSAMLDLVRDMGCDGAKCDWIDLYPKAEKNPDGLTHVEDTYLSRLLWEHQRKYSGRIPTPAKAGEFAMETFHGVHGADHRSLRGKVSPWAVHRIWSYMPHELWQPFMSRVKQYYPELWKK